MDLTTWDSGEIIMELKEPFSMETWMLKNLTFANAVRLFLSNNVTVADRLVVSGPVVSRHVVSLTFGLLDTWTFGHLVFGTNELLDIWPF